MATPHLPLVGAATDVGHRRERNEDSMLAEGSVYVVADGMGGHAAGDVASALAVQAFRPLASRDDLTPDDVVAATHEANRAIMASAAEHREQGGMGTTLTGVVAVVLDGEPAWAVVNVGDSRTYRWSGGELRQLSIDHSEVQELLDLGALTPDEAVRYVRRNVVTRSLGHESGDEVDVRVLPRQPGEWFVACSDGLTDELDDAALAKVLGSALRSPGDEQGAAEALVSAALRAGGRDNVTVVVIGTPGP